MLKTITTTSQSLNDLLTQNEKDTAKFTRKGNDNKEGNQSRHNVLIQNLGATDIYIEFGDTATTTGGVKIIVDASFSFSDVYLTDCHLIADTSDNTGARIVIN